MANCESAMKADNLVLGEIRDWKMVYMGVRCYNRNKLTTSTCLIVESTE